MFNQANEHFTNQKYEVNVWITWIIKNARYGVLGQAYLGKGILEDTLGDCNCDSNIQLYYVKSVESITVYGLSYSIDLKHVEELYKLCIHHYPIIFLLSSKLILEKSNHILKNENKN